MGDSKNNMKVLGVDQFIGPLSDPPYLSVPLAFWACAMFLQEIRYGERAACGTRLDMPAERCCSAVQNSIDRFVLERNQKR